MSHQRRVSGVSVKGNASRSPLNVDNLTDGVGVSGVKRRNSAQNGIHGGIQFLQRAEEEDGGDNDAGSPLLDDLDLGEEDQGNSDRRTRAEAKSIRKVSISRRLSAISSSDDFTSCRSRTLKSPTGL